MIIIKFKDGTDWFKANWIFKQLAEDVIAIFPNDRNLRSVMERAQAVGGVFFDSMEADVAAATVKAIKKVAEDTVQGRIQGWSATRPEDKDGQRMYFDSINELLRILNHADVG